MTGTRSHRTGRAASRAWRPQLIMYVQRYYARNGYCPTIGEICDALGQTGPRPQKSSVHRLLRKIAAAGWISAPRRYVARGYGPVILGWAVVDGTALPVYPVTI